MIRSLFAALLLLAAPALAGNSADEADVAFALGNRAYAHHDYEEALAKYFLSYRLVANRNVLFNIARCYESLGKYDEAFRYYDDLLGLDLPAADRRDVQASVARLRPKVALLHVESNPQGAEVFVDRLDLGSRGHTPLTIALSPGRHRITAQKDGFVTAEASASLERGREDSHTLALRELTGQVHVFGSPTGAEVRESLEGKVLGEVPCTLSLAPGKRLLWVTAKGHLPVQLLVDVAPDKPAEQKVALPDRPPPTGKVVVTANRENALVTVDGREAGFTPVVLTLPEGEHQIAVSSPELSPDETTVSVGEGTQASFKAQLRYRPPPVKAASKTLTAIEDAPASVTVISADEIRAFGYTTLPEALRAVRGIFVTDDRQYSYVGIRGFSPPGDLNTRILILWDGHPMNDVWAGQGYAGRELSVDLAEVDRIEVVRGPGSALYGTGAFFAVINIVPRESLGGRHVEVQGGAGSLGQWGTHAAAAYREGEASFLLSGGAFGASGADLTDLGALGRVAGLDGERAYGASGRVSAGPFTLVAQVNRRIKDIPDAPFGVVVNTPGTDVADNRGFAELRFEKTLGPGDFFGRAYYDGSRYRGHWPYAQPDGSLERETDSGAADWIGTELRYRVPLGARNALTVGTEAQDQLRVDQAVFSSSDIPLATQKRTLLSGYLLDEWRPTAWLALSAGLRVDKYLDLSSAPVTPRLGVVLRPYAGGLTKLVAGQAFRVPNVYELDYGDGGQTQIPGGNLSPEKITTIELEHTHALADELHLTLAAYQNRISDLVVLANQTGPARCGDASAPVSCLQYQNAGQTLIATGAEAELRWQPTRLTLVDLSYSYVALHGGFDDVRAAAPAHLASARVLFPLSESLRLSTQASYQSARHTGLDQPAGEALLIDLGISGEVDHLRYFAGVKNLLDEKYALPVGSEFSIPAVPQYGRTFLVQLAAGF
jgi:outer membrane receptor for ferrienterochelin and colicins